MENNVGIQIAEKLTELNQLEMEKAKVMAEIYERTTNSLVLQKVDALEKNFKEQAQYYGQNLKNYDEIYKRIVLKYTEQLQQIVDKYNEFYINAQLELQEAECNQKIAITNWKKSVDIEQELKKEETREAYKKRIRACLQKKTNYDVIIEECQKELIACSDNIQKQINSLFGNKDSQVLRKDENTFSKILRTIANKFSGANKFNMYVIEPLNIEIEMMDGKLPDIKNNIKEKTINFVAKIKQAKDETNKIFNHMIDR